MSGVHAREKRLLAECHFTRTVCAGTQAAREERRCCVEIWNCCSPIAIVVHNQISILHPSPGAEDGFSFFSNLLLRSHQKDPCCFRNGKHLQWYRQTEKKTSILGILAAYDSEWNEKLVDVQCCADILPCFIPLLSTQVLASGTQRFTHEELSSFHQL